MATAKKAAAAKKAAPKAKTIHDMSLLELIDRATNIYGITTTPDMGREDIIDLILNRKSQKKVEKPAETSNAPKPGWARIIIHRDPTPGASNKAIYWQVNGYHCTIKRGVEVDVPIALVEGPMKDAIVKVRKENEALPDNHPEKYYEEYVPSYPFSVLAMTPGPMPKVYEQKTAHKTRVARTRPKDQFREMFGMYPTQRQLDAAIRDGVISLDGVTEAVRKRHDPTEELYADGFNSEDLS